MQDKLKELLKKQVVIFDGAMGTEIYKHHFFINNSFEGLCLSNADVISEIHESYYNAGAQVLTANSYGANTNKLTRFGLADKMVEINQRAVAIARESGAEQCLVAGSVGPVGDITVGDRDNDKKIVEILSEHITALEVAGADFILFETLSSVRDVEYAIQAITQSPNIPYMMSFSVDRNAETAKGEHISKLVSALSSCGDHTPTALGLNCGNGAEGMLTALETFIGLTSYPVVVQPNAGLPKKVDNRMIYMTSPEYLTTYAVRYVNLGARGVGGCCGTGPEHITDIARSVSPLSHSEQRVQAIITDHKEVLKDPVPTAEKTKFGAKLAKGEWVSSVEITPPRGYQLQATIDKAIRCREAGVDAINIPDGPRASSRISPIITALQIEREAGIEAVLHFCCRDKNLIGMQADLLGCSAVGLNNILFITGDPPKLGDYPFASAVFDVDSIGMVEIQDRLNRGVDLGGRGIDPPTRTLIGVGADPNAIDMERELRRTEEKVQKGAEYIITQPVFATEPLLRFLDSISHLDIPVIAGIWPLASYRNAEFMKNEVPGVVVPDDIMEKMGKADTKEAQREEGIGIAKECVAKIRDRIDGIQVSAPFGNVETAISVISG